MHGKQKRWSQLSIEDLFSGLIISWHIVHKSDFLTYRFSILDDLYYFTFVYYVFGSSGLFSVVLVLVKRLLFLLPFSIYVSTSSFAESARGLFFIAPWIPLRAPISPNALILFDYTIIFFSAISAFYLEVYLDRLDLPVPMISSRFLSSASGMSYFYIYLWYLFMLYNILFYK